MWDRTFDEEKGFAGAGSIWLPSTPGKHSLDNPLWKTKSPNLLQSLRESLLPSVVDITQIRELSRSPYLRSQYECEQVGLLQIELYVTMQGFEQFGVQFEEKSS